MSTVVTLQEFKDALGVTGTDQDTALQIYLDGAEAAAGRYCHAVFPNATYTEYHSGANQRDLLLRQRPVISVTTVHVDGSGAFGSGPNAFAAATLQAAGTDYALVRDGAAGAGQSGILRRLGLGTAWLEGGHPGGKLATGYRPSSWPFGDGNIKVVYVAGYTAPYPADLKLGITAWASAVRATLPLGGRAYQSERLGEYAYSLMAAAEAKGDVDGHLGSARVLLEPFVNRWL